LLSGGGLGRDVLLLDLIELALGIDYVQVVGEPAVIARGGEIDGAL
jgi:hypothetical protein